MKQKIPPRSDLCLLGLLSQSRAATFISNLLLATPPSIVVDKNPAELSFLSSIFQPLPHLFPFLVVSSSAVSTSHSSGDRTRDSLPGRPLWGHSCSFFKERIFILFSKGSETRQRVRTAVSEPLWDPVYLSPECFDVASAVASLPSGQPCALR
uniref:Uncharacterized protein n=1 Tax=Myotis myotis TaxID=51298 RepID=A0A7J7T6D2_MYOMY|nr:hypothetical protein mMyoMyo1_009195 [Myotis myotis]